MPALTPNGSYLECTAPTFGPYAIVGSAPAAVTTSDGKVTFQGTYDRRTFTSADKSVLFMGSNSTLYYPDGPMTINPFRAFFKLSDSNAQVRAFVLNFGTDDDEPTGIRSEELGVRS